MGGKGESLEELQAWFGRGISQSFPIAFEGNPLALTAPQLQGEADGRLRAHHGLTGFDRLGIYNKQYWFRLITVMQGEYACAVHVLGLREFNAWVIRFLDAHPPASPFLAFLDVEFPAFLAARYRDADREAVLQAVAFDRAFSRAFDAPAGRALNAPADDPAALLSRPMCLAPHATLLRLDHDWPAFRALCLADESLEEKVELLPADLRLMIYRSRSLTLMQMPLSSAAFRVLEGLRTPARIDRVFEQLEGTLSPQEQEELEANLGDWFRDWAAWGWLCDGAGEAPVAGTAGAAQGA